MSTSGRWNELGIGPKVILATIVVFAVLMVTGAYFLGEQLRGDLNRVMSNQAGIIEQQIQVTRAYVAKQFVVKAKGAGMKVSMEHDAPDTIPFPATFTRETSETLAKEGVYNARVISSTPLNPANRPQDSFEEQALKALASGQQEFVSIEPVDGAMMYRRATADLASVKACVSCHAGKQVGDMLGAVSVQIPMGAPLAQLNSNLNNVYMGIALVGLVTVGLLAMLLSRMVIKPMKELEAMAAMAKDGDLSVRTQTASRDEIGRASESFNVMFDRVSEVVQSVKSAVSGITTGTREISQGNEDLSQRTSAQAGALEETSASMEEMTSTIKQNADNAKQANQLAVAAREVAEKGGTVTDKAVNAMDEINKSSKKIADIINVIDEIAFQTNLLALNAAVEAARAGEQGRGFAVVASEVRNLAQRSATAAKEIKSLINESVQKVSDGSDLVNQSGKTLEEIVNSVKRVTDIIAEISAASQEQASGIDQVNKAVMQMDQGTQQNAALVEQATSASQSMKQQAEALLEQVEFFKTEGQRISHKTPTAGDQSSGESSNLFEDKKNVPSPANASPSMVPSAAPKPVSVGSSNGHKASSVDDDFFEEF